ncbi:MULTISPECIES: RHS repeat-associated core domain-containing protein [unclassified Luteibacter]|uniref:RHS repeat-associated core domain-containing protein n=1 Tax=Luteibacter sp. PvP019 TaxID=3156436 RepID=UPI00339543CC
MPLFLGCMSSVCARAISILLFAGALCAFVGALHAAPVTQWGPPYYAEGWQAGHTCQDNTSIYKDRTVDEDTIDAARADFAAALRGCYGLGCTVTLQPVDPATHGGTVADTVLGGGCYIVGPRIKATSSVPSPSDDGPGGDGGGHHHDDSTPTVGDPANAQTGDKILHVVDYAGTPWLEFQRFYSSNDDIDTTSIGIQWRHSFDRTLQVLGHPVTTAVATRPDGSKSTYHRTNGVWTADASSGQRLTESVDGNGAIVAYHLFVSISQRDETYDASGRLIAIADAYGQGVSLTYSDASTPTSVAPKAGLLIKVIDKKGRALAFSYDAKGRITALGLPDGTNITYAYTSEGYLDTVTFADTKFIEYFYNESGLFHTAYGPLLTGIVDEAAQRYATIAYDDQRRTAGMNFGGDRAGTTGSGSNGTQFTYNADGTTTVTFALGGKANLSFSSPAGLSRLAGVDTACNPDCDLAYQARTYDASGYPASTTDFLGRVTQTQYNAYGQVTSKVEAVGTDSQRTTTTTWDDALRVPTLRSVADKSGTITQKEGWAYDASGKLLARCEIDAAKAPSYVCVATGMPPAGVRRWTYSYCTGTESGCAFAGLLKSVQGPRTDVSSAVQYTYYTDTATTGCGTPGSACHQPGDLRTATDPVGHAVTFASYDGAGRVTRVVDGNGTITDTTYTSRGWVGSRTVDGAKTVFTYTPYGEVASITDPDGVVMRYGYDAAHRLIWTDDALGNALVYTLDQAGNVTAERVADVGNHTLRQRSQQFNALGQLTAVTDGLNQTIFSAADAGDYDAQGSLIQHSDGLGVLERQSWDPLRRLVGTVRNYNGADAAIRNAATTLAYDASDRVVGITDPSNLNTFPSFDGLGNRVGLQSPDSGISADTYDAAGNHTGHTDARNVVRHYAYDAADRVTAQTFADTSLNATYAYDEANSITGCTASKPIGRLTRIVEKSVTTVFCYDGTGRVIQKKQLQGTVTDTISYGYTAAGRLKTLVNPDQTVLTYSRNSLGQVTAIAATPVAGKAVNAVTAVTYLPFGPVLSYKLGNGQTVTRTYDANYAATDVVSPAVTLHFTRDVLGRIAGVSDRTTTTPIAEQYAYDSLGRLVRVGTAAAATQTFTYNLTGDRLTKSGSGTATGAYAYLANSHRLSGIGNAARTSDASGNTTAAVSAGQTFGYGYDGRGRLTVVQANGQTVGAYTVSALGQRTMKMVGATATRFVYDENAHLLGDYAASSRRNIVWMDDIPVATVDTTATTSAVNYIHADALGTPRAVTNAAGGVVWLWHYTSNAFGEVAPTVTGSYALNLRYAGQYFDVESGLVYNVNRTYEASTGRYLESDPTGLEGGISTYLYALGQPLNLVDPLGLDPHDYRHVPYYPYGMWTDPEQARVYPDGPAGSSDGVPSPAVDAGGLGLGMGLGGEVGIGMGSFGAGLIGIGFGEGATHADYGNEPYIQHTMPRQ